MTCPTPDLHVMGRFRVLASCPNCAESTTDVPSDVHEIPGSQTREHERSRACWCFPLLADHPLFTYVLHRNEETTNA